jgi:hypothetical protein
LENTQGIPAERVQVIGNAVDLTRFRPRPPLSGKPERACSSATTREHFPWSAEYADSGDQCPRALRPASKTAVPNPEGARQQCDIVFAVGRCALEAMTVGWRRRGVVRFCRRRADGHLHRLRRTSPCEFSTKRAGEASAAGVSKSGSCAVMIPTTPLLWCRFAEGSS